MGMMGVAHSKYSRTPYGYIQMNAIGSSKTSDKSGLGVLDFQKANDRIHDSQWPAIQWKREANFDKEDESDLNYEVK